MDELLPNHIGDLWIVNALQAFGGGDTNLLVFTFELLGDDHRIFGARVSRQRLNGSGLHYRVAIFVNVQTVQVHIDGLATEARVTDE